MDNKEAIPIRFRFRFQSLTEMIEQYSEPCLRRKRTSSSSGREGDIVRFNQEVDEMLDKEFMAMKPRKSIRELEEIDFSSRSPQWAPEKLPITVLPMSDSLDSRTQSTEEAAGDADLTQSKVIWLPESRMKLAENLPEHMPRLYDERLSSVLASPILHRVRRSPSN